MRDFVILSNFQGEIVRTLNGMQILIRGDDSQNWEEGAISENLESQ